MHEIKFSEFVKGVALGLVNAVKTDVDVFLLVVAAILWPFNKLKGFFFSTLLYVIFRRADGMMSVYTSLKQRELERAE